MRYKIIKNEGRRAHESAIASEAHTGASLAWPAGYTTPAAIGNATTLYTVAHSYI